MANRTKKGKYNLFQADVDGAVLPGGVTLEDFEAATADEKKAMTETHASVSYWKDAWRRFRQNRVSMIALGVFLLIALFAFIGPTLIPYNYGDQYRGALKLAPFEYSETERTALTLIEQSDGIYMTAMQPTRADNKSVSVPYLAKKTDYVIYDKGNAYCFRLEKSKDKIILLFDSDSETPVVMFNEKDYTGEIPSGKLTVIETTSEVPEGAIALPIATSVFPHMFGTDSNGRDIMARCMYGARVSLIVGIVAALIVLIIGASYGATMGLSGGATDFVMMRIVELIYSVPDTLTVLLLQVVLKDPLKEWFESSDLAIVKSMSSLGVGIVSIFITFALLYWVGMARIIRGQVLMLKQQEYVTAARALGASNARIIKRHLLPNCVGQIVIATCLQIPSAIFLESFLSFLGLGVSAPMASLGSLCADAIDTLTIYPYRLLIPAILLTLTVLSLNLVGDGLRDALDPRLKK